MLLLTSQQHASCLGYMDFIPCWLQGFPIGGMASTATVAFHAGIASILGLYAVFWLRLTIIDTLLPLAGLSLFTFLAGFKALSHHARAEMGSPAHPPVVLKRE